ncbi:hypothetical protein BGW80DRAFT_857527 [Lactifluus volemus]|nr:hypothetical protein BGW80DRAFT_857527 [Lactifluus volemus]
MVKFHDPIVINQDYFDLFKLLHILAGIYIWEVVVTAGFELDVLRGKLPYRPTIWLYLGTRYTALFTFIVFLIRADGTTRVSCRFAILDDALVYASWSCASLLIALRVIAIWDRNTFVSSLVIGTWLAGIAFYIYNLVEMRTSYEPFLGMCVNANTRRFLVNAVSMLVIDVVLLISMLVGLVRSPHSGSFGLWQVLFQQSIIWLVLVTISDLPLMVFLILNLNNPMNEVHRCNSHISRFVPTYTLHQFCVL